MSKQVRVGIDVGGTFTDVVVIDHATREVISQSSRFFMLFLVKNTPF